MKTPKEEILKEFKKQVKARHIQNMVIGFQTAMCMIIDYCNDEKRTIEDVVGFCEKCIDPNNNALEKIVNKDGRNKKIRNNKNDS